MTLPLTIDPEFQSLIPPLSDDERAQLEASLKAEGCRDALVAWKQNDTLTLVDGHNRYELCKRHGIEYKVIEREFESREDVIVWIVNNQLARRNLTQYARDALVLKMSGLVEAIRSKAKANLVTSTGGASPQPLQNFAKPAPINTREKLAEISGSNRENIRKVETVEKDAPESIKQKAWRGELSVDRAFKLTRAIEKASPEIKAAVVKAEIDDPAMVDMLEEKKDTETVQSLISTGMLQPGEEKDAKSITQITPLDLERELRAREKEHKQRGIDLKREQIRDSAAKQAELTGAYSVIYADPPWEYQNSGIDASAASRYPTMPTADICGLLKANKIEATENAALFLWATNPLLLDALKVLEAWGFTYRTNLVWTKNNHAGGFYVRGQHELLLIATRGSFLPVLTYSSHLHAPITRHSEKPPILYTMIESMYPKQQYLELFARDVEQRKDWTYWGGEVKYANAA